MDIRYLLVSSLGIPISSNESDAMHLAKLAASTALLSKGNSTAPSCFLLGDMLHHIIPVAELPFLVILIANQRRRNVPLCGFVIANMLHGSFHQQLRTLAVELELRSQLQNANSTYFDSTLSGSIQDLPQYDAVISTLQIFEERYVARLMQHQGILSNAIAPLLDFSKDLIYPQLQVYLVQVFHHTSSVLASIQSDASAVIENLSTYHASCSLPISEWASAVLVFRNKLRRDVLPSELSGSTKVVRFNMTSSAVHSKALVLCKCSKVDANLLVAIALPRHYIEEENPLNDEQRGQLLLIHDKSCLPIGFIRALDAAVIRLDRLLAMIPSDELMSGESEDIVDALCRTQSSLASPKPPAVLLATNNEENKTSVQRPRPGRSYSAAKI